MNKIYFISCAINRQDRMSVVTTFRKHCKSSKLHVEQHNSDFT